MIVMKTPRLPSVGRDTVTDLKMMLSGVQPVHCLWFRWESCLLDARLSKAPWERSHSSDVALPRKRPPRTRVGDEVPAEILEHMPDVPFELDEQKFLTNLRKSRRGAAAGPSGMTSDHLRPALQVWVSSSHELRHVIRSLPQ